MNRQEFIIALRSELKKLPPEEIVAATEFYEELFDELLESGGMTEEEVLKEVGSPKRAAAQIKADYAARILNGDESILDEKPTVKKKISAMWWVIIGIVTAPVSIPIAICAAVVAFSVFFGALSIILSIYGTIIFTAVMAIVAMVLGVIALTEAVTTGIMFIGAGLLMASASAAAGVGAFIGTRALIRAIAKACRNEREKHRFKKTGKKADMSSGGEWTYAQKPEDPVGKAKPESNKAKKDSGIGSEEEFMEEIRADAAAEADAFERERRRHNVPSGFRANSAMTMPECPRMAKDTKRGENDE